MKNRVEDLLAMLILVGGCFTLVKFLHWLAQGVTL